MEPTVKDAFQSYVQILYASSAILPFGAIVVELLGKPPEFSGEKAIAD